MPSVSRLVFLAAVSCTLVGLAGAAFGASATLVALAMNGVCG